MITDGFAVLGLGDIGPAAGMPVDGGRSSSSRSSAVDAFPSVDTKDDKLVETIALIPKSFGGINLATRCRSRRFEGSAA